MNSNVIQPQVSIGMPVYNGENYICEALDSLLAQTFTDFELIISDNASTDNTEQICKTYAACDNRIRYIRQKENIGATNNFRFVLEQAKGDYFMWAAHDDLWSPNWLESLVNLATTNKSAAFGVANYIGENGQPVWHLGAGTPLTFLSLNLSILRRLLYFVFPVTNSKDCVFYGLYPKSSMISLEVFEYFFGGKEYPDVVGDVVVYIILKNIKIMIAANAIFKKRLHPKSGTSEAIAALNKQKTSINKNLFTRFYNLIHYSFTFPCYFDYARYSSLFEVVLLSILYPVAALQISIALISDFYHQKVLNKKII
ncbi:glycosyltransferase [Synechococcus sp. PCC 6716]|nr:glycosyltransferase [Synechococcus sp. PCC 6716]